MSPRILAPYGENFGAPFPRTTFGQASANVRGRGEPQAVALVGVMRGTGGANFVQRSEDDGATWTQIVTPSAPLRDWRYIAYSPPLGRLVIVGTDTVGDVLTSDDLGLTWTQRTGVIPFVAGHDRFRRIEWISELSVFVCIEGTGSSAAYTQWCCISADGITWTRPDTGSANVRGGCGAVWMDSIGQLGIATESINQTARLAFTPDLVAYSQISQGGGGFDNPSVIEGSFGANPKPFIAPDGSFVCGCIQGSSFAQAQFMRSVNGVLLQYDDLAMSNNADSLGGACDPASGACFIQSCVNNNTLQTKSITDGNTWAAQATGLGVRDRVMYKYLPRIEKHVLCCNDGTAVNKLFSSDTGEGGSYANMGTLAVNRALFDVTEAF